MKTMTAAMAADACGGRLYHCEHPDSPLGRIVIDSRAVENGDVFAAFHGEKTDGHAYIKTALEKGAACCIAEYVPEGVEGDLILTDNVQSAVEKIAAAYRETLTLPVIGITGSVGKTTAKEMVSAVLSQRFSVLKTEGNLNNQIGVPMTVSRIEREHELAVVEMGISGFGEMTALSKIAKPTIALFTVIGHAHLEFLHDLEGVFKAKTEMLDFLPDDGAVIFNGDDAMLRRISCHQRLVSYGLGKDCTVRAENVKLLPEGRTLCDIVFDNRRLRADVPAYGQQMVYAALEGAAAGFVMGLTDEEIVNGLASYQIVGRRGAVTDTGFVTLIDDSYNANPDSMRCSIDSLSKLKGRRVCVLADMLEMGSGTEQMHYDIGRYAKEKGIELVLACGSLGRELARGAGDIAVYFPTEDELIAALPRYLHTGDTVLTKASRGMHLERAADAIKELKL